MRAENMSQPKIIFMHRYLYNNTNTKVMITINITKRTALINAPNALVPTLSDDCSLYTKNITIYIYFPSKKKNMNTKETLFFFFFFKKKPFRSHISLHHIKYTIIQTTKFSFPFKNIHKNKI